MLAVDFFFAGMGGAMLIVAAIIDLFIGKNQISVLAVITSYSIHYTKLYDTQLQTQRFSTASTTYFESE